MRIDATMKIRPRKALEKVARQELVLVARAREKVYNARQHDKSPDLPGQWRVSQGPAPQTQVAKPSQHQSQGEFRGPFRVFVLHGS